jgi:peroxiredoxin Q/BCP
LTLQVGDPAPDFTAATHDGGSISLSGLRGKWVVLYFYPKDNTPGCTIEACGFRDRWDRFRDLGAVVLGVSADSARAHERFTSKFRLPFPLLLDEEKKILNAYGVYSPKSFMGRIGLGIHRVTFLINPEGRIAHVWPKVKTLGHAEDVLKILKTAMAGASER